ncbi:MAG: asparagine synthase [Kordiimonadaceae bacterium]|nr:asparagine synthase [Kordiimonadaceae bacterium]
MYRYLSLIWNEADSQATETAEFLTTYFQGTKTKWDVAYGGKGLRVLHTGEEKNRTQAYALDTQQDGSGGVVLGKLFNRAKRMDSIPGNAELGVGEARKVINSAGRHLVDDYWGSWVAFFQAGNKKHVLVDPIGTFCCFSTHYRGVEIYFTYVPDIASCEFLSFSIDWIPIARNIRYGFEHTETGLKEMDKVPSGQCITITPWATEKTLYWNPQKISQTDVIEDVQEAEATLRQMLLTTVAALVEPYDNVFLQLGGLDSSIVLACLREAPTTPEITCVNIFHDSPMGDERYYTRKATNHVGVKLIEYPEGTANLDFKVMLNTRKVARPYFHAQVLGLEKDMLRMTAENGGQAIFGGRGGDEILYATRSNYGAIDYLKSHGLQPSLLRLAMEAARIQSLSVWSILPKIIRDGYGNKQWDFYKDLGIGKTRILTEEIQDLIKPDGSVHPWVMQKHGVPPGKLDHIMTYTMGTYSEECKLHPDDHILQIQPMLSQPVIELCLRIPSWVMTTDGKTRGLARKAFQHFLPPEVIWRESKMAFNNYTQTIVRENSAFLKDMLLGGILVADHIADKAHIEKILRQDHDCEEMDAMNLASLLNAEIWARNWRGKTLESLQHTNAA